MEVAIGSNGSTPFQREVREWQRVDPNTGALLTGRLEADRWINGPLNAYGKVVDSQNVSKPNGTQHTQRKQLEVLQARTSSGSLQVVRAQTVQTTSSRWSSGIRGATSSAFDSGSKFTNGGLHLTNGHASDINDDHLTNPINSNLLTAPSLKLSTLMKSSNATNGDRTSPHSVTNSMSLVQRHQQHFKQQQQQQQKHETEIQPNLTDARYQPTLGEVRVGGGSVEQMGLFRNERETADANKLPHLQRGRSVSTDDLSTDRDNEDGEDPSEWRRVSKIRRSFQFPKSTSPKPIPTRPLDLPENSVSVSRIRQELENGRRLNTAMRNNHVDLAALDSILNGSLETAESKSTKKTSFLTAESLKEIRGKLKKLSDESLYKDDFIMQGDRDKETEKETSSSSAESRLHVQHQVVLKDSQLVHQPAFQYHPKTEAVHTTNSLENRTRYRDTTSAEWHLRRKSYGFEKMSPQDSSMFRLETSTDSGIGRSGDLTQWSPTETTPRSTVITLGEKVTPVKATVTLVNGHESAATVPKPVVHRRFLAKTIESTESSEVKRHSIAVDESKYVRDNLRKVFDAKTSVHLNGLYMKESNSSQTSINDENGRRQKRVEFCKTEVHFAAESGRVNIVETDGKPPPTNNFRRRRRSSGSSIGSAYLEAINSGLPVIHFGDEKKTVFEQETTIEESPVSLRNNVTVSVPTAPEGVISKIMQDEEDDGSDEISLRGILKNKPIKPKPYHLGENIDNSDSLWGVRLKPVATTDLLSVKPSSFDTIQERTPIDNTRLEPVTENKEATTIASLKSVAERIRIVEERKDGSGYSTKINLNLSNSPYSWTSPEAVKSNITSISLHSPTKNLIAPTTSTTTSSITLPSNNEVPVAKPRTLPTIKTPRSVHSEMSEINKTFHTETVRTAASHKIETNKTKEPLKIAAGGARKLRDHELSYFGVKVTNGETKLKSQQRTSSTTNNNNETNRKLISSSTNGMEFSTKWKLTSDKPDLLRHSPVTDGKNAVQESVLPKAASSDGPIYENLKKPSSYNRKKDLQRDEMILSEMTKDADQTLEAVSTEIFHRDQQRRTTPQRTTQPLDTIDEKVPTHHQPQQKSMKSKAIQVSRPGGESFQRPCCSSGRPSSASSTESLTRLSSSGSIKVTKSGSKDSKDKIEYASVRATRKVTPTPPRECSKSHQRSSSRDTQRTRASSSEDLPSTQKAELVRRTKRSKTRESESSTSRIDERSRTSRTSAERDDKHKSVSRSTHDHSKSNRRPAKSDKVERVDKVSSVRSKGSSTITQDYQQKSSRNKVTSGHLTSTTSSSSKRVSKDHIRK